MPFPAAKQGDQVLGVDLHIVVPPAPAPPVLMPVPFSGPLNGGLSRDVMIEGKPAAVVGSTADNQPRHIAPVGAFQKEPANRGTVKAGSRTVFVNGTALARAGDPVDTCNDPQDLPNGTIMAVGTVMAG